MGGGGGGVCVLTLTIDFDFLTFVVSMSSTSPSPPKLPKKKHQGPINLIVKTVQLPNCQTAKLPTVREKKNAHWSGNWLNAEGLPVKQVGKKQCHQNGKPPMAMGGGQAINKPYLGSNIVSFFLFCAETQPLFTIH